ncbi:uncharacterized protein PHALS_03089 [Plasmopara halstedii]|uniref:Uncharacterized protein n=1 Tax=Plasmopara halstedii TaxID=4781 RepID=A0A0P1A7C3_PLAHL|nr:uncharacterized protein PHALS_03089 [Plasmopara halstedii]CEG36541.1 hypothetical protein PHALS_03089 [Plasmopara halstedii]|eukprot:XP_024572910.1 hypothetical protein PHALS_03089 [Plasmopara halstedii]
MKSTVATAVVSHVPIVVEAELTMEEKLNVYHYLVVCDESAVAFVLDPRLKRFAGLDAANQGAARDKVLALMGAKPFENARPDRVAREANKPVSLFESLSGTQEAGQTGFELTAVEQLEEYGKQRWPGSRPIFETGGRCMKVSGSFWQRLLASVWEWSQPLFRQSAYSPTPGT